MLACPEDDFPDVTKTTAIQKAFRLMQAPANFIMPYLRE